MRVLNVYLGLFLVMLVGYVVFEAVQLAQTGGEGAEHLVDLAEAIFSLPLFAGASVVWLGGTFKPQIAALLERRAHRRPLGAAAAADAEALLWIATHSSTGVSDSDFSAWLSRRGHSSEIAAQLIARNWIDAPKPGHLALSGAGGDILRQWTARTT